MRFTSIAVAGCATALLCGFLAPAAAAQGAPAETRGVTVAEEKASRAETLAYWTPERTKEALENPAPLRRQKAERTEPGRKSVAGEGVSASADAVLGKAARQAGYAEQQQSGIMHAAAEEISVSQPVPYSTSYPNTMAGKLLYTAADGSNHSCTAAAIVSATKNAVWTAGHCIHAGDGSGDAGFHHNIKFLPGYKQGQKPWGEWTVDRKIVPTGWADGGDTLQSDLGALVLAPHPTYGNFQDAIGALGYRFSSTTDYPDALNYGYPGEGYNRTDLDAEQMMYCRGNVEDNNPWLFIDDRMKMDCDMGGGASGGPVFIGSDQYNPQIVGANSHTIGETVRENDDLLSSLHADNAVDVINTVNGV